MSGKMIVSVSAFVLMILLVSGCANVSYIGNSYEATTSIETYYSEDDIPKEYTIIGHAVGLSIVAGNDKIYAKLIKSAKLKGADAILITGIDKSEVLISAGIATGENQIFASFLKYK